MTRTLLCAALFLTACGSRNVASLDGAPDGTPDGPASPDLHNDWKMPPPDHDVVDLPPLPADAPGPVTDAPCTCKPGEVWLRGPCVPTFKLQTCAPTCDPKLPGACGPPTQKCDPWAAAPACMASAAVPACVPGQAMAFPVGTLRIHPTTGIAGTPVGITIQGGDPYIGALMWMLQVGGKPGPTINPAGGCSTKFSFTPPKPGIYPVELGYGGGSSVKSWSLAGFYTASGGSIPPKQAQPGERCGGGTGCVSAKPYSCSCVSSRCVCTK
jgi:hypothetical protein